MEKLHDSVELLFAEVQQPTDDRKPQAEASANNTSDEPLIEKEIIKDKEEQPTHEVSPEMLDSSCDLGIGLADFFQTSVFTWLVNSKKNKKLISLYGEGALDKLEHLINEQDAGKNNKLQHAILREFSPDEMGMLRLAKEVNKIVDDLPFTDSEKEAIKVPLMALLKESGGSLSPQWALTFAALQIFGSRALQTLTL
jgi:uncharacterized protein with ParB-like and HNH nuclease domain